VCFALEIDPLYVDVAVRRWQAFTGGHAILLADAVHSMLSPRRDCARPKRDPSAQRTWNL